MPIYFGSTPIASVKKAAASVASLKVPSIADPGQLVEILQAPPAQVTGLAVDSTGDGTLDLSWTAPASDATITDYSVEYTDVQPLTGVALLAPFDADLDDVLGITGTATNTPTITSGGKFGSYADLGAADKLTYSSVSFGSGDYTVECWITRTESSWAPNGGNPLLELPGVAMLGRAGTDTLELYEDDFGSWAAVSGTTTSSIDQDWHHVALVRDGSTLRFYLDGSQVGTMSTSSNPSSLVFGASTIYGCRFGLDDLRVSTSAVYPSGTTFTPPTSAHPTSGGGTTATVLVGSAATSYQLTGLTNDTEYTISVAAVSAAGTGTYSTTVTGTPEADGWDISTATYVQSLDVSAQESVPQSVALKTDGTKLYTIGNANAILEYDLGTAFDLSSASYSQSHSVSTQSGVAGLFFRADGLRAFFTDTGGSDSVHQLNLSTAWDISSASFIQSYSVSAKETQPTGLFFRGDGLKMYMTGPVYDTVHEYDLSTAWDISTLTFSQGFSAIFQESGVRGVFFKPDGLKMYVTGFASDSVHEYDLSTAWDVSTATHSQSFSMSAQSVNGMAVWFDSVGRRMYAASSTGIIAQYALSASP